MRHPLPFIYCVYPELCYSGMLQVGTSHIQLCKLSVQAWHSLQFSQVSYLWNWNVFCKIYPNLIFLNSGSNKIKFGWIFFPIFQLFFLFLFLFLNFFQSLFLKSHTLRKVLDTEIHSLVRKHVIGSLNHPSYIPVYYRKLFCSFQPFVSFGLLCLGCAARKK